jgi:hypothetical protein
LPRKKQRIKETRKMRNGTMIKHFLINTDFFDTCVDHPGIENIYVKITGSGDYSGDIVHRVNREYLKEKYKKLFECGLLAIYYGWYSYTAIEIVKKQINPEWLSKTIDDLHYNDENEIESLFGEFLADIEKTEDYPLLDDDLYCEIQVNMVDKEIEELQKNKPCRVFLDNFEEQAIEYLIGKCFYDSFIDYCESDFWKTLQNEWHDPIDVV